jgi:hypothetical protein
MIEADGLVGQQAKRKPKKPANRWRNKYLVGRAFTTRKGHHYRAGEHPGAYLPAAGWRSFGVTKFEPTVSS